MRLFVAVELDDTVRAACAAAAADVAARLGAARIPVSIRRVPEENLHITLTFLGHIDDAKAVEVGDVLRAEWDVAQFPLALAGAGAFPPFGPPRILWVGISEGSEQLTAVHREVTLRLSTVGFEPERRAFHPHVTIGRVKDAGRNASQARRIVAAANVRAASSRVRSVTLFESRLSRDAARYEPLLRVPLKGC